MAFGNPYGFYQPPAYFGQTGAAPDQLNKIVLLAKDGELRGDDALMYGHAGGYDVRGRRVRDRDRAEREHPSGSREHMIRRMMEMLSAEGDEKQKEMLHKWIEQMESE